MDAVKKKMIVIYCYYSDDILLSLSMFTMIIVINQQMCPTLLQFAYVS